MMAEARSLRWWTAQQLAGLAATLEAELAGWSAAWGVPAGTVQAELAHAAAAVPGPWHAMAGAAAPAWTTQLAPAQLRQALFAETGPAIHPEGYGTLAEALAHSCRDAWYACLLRWTRPDDAPAAACPAAPPASDRLAWSGAVRLTIRGDAWEQHVHLSAAAASRLMEPVAAPAASGPMPPLASVREALAARPLTLRLELAGLELDVGSLQQLAVGDVVRLPHLLSQPLTLRAAELPLQCAAYLGQRDGRYAVELSRADSK
jgi:flagellar motor switch/type III secretory pathway protein FliN